MALIDHFAPDAGENGFTRIPAHEFVATLGIAREGVFGNAAAALKRIQDEFGLKTEDNAQLGVLRTALTGKSDDGGKAQFIKSLENGLIAYESGHITADELKTYMGL